jgi:uncharacterized protein (TIGR02302 family)
VAIDSNHTNGHDASKDEAHLARLQSRALLALAFEGLWPHLARLLLVVLLFVAASWAGLWQVLARSGCYDALHILTFAIFAVLLGAALWPLLRWRMPSQMDVLQRLDARSHKTHRPVTALNDRLAVDRDPLTRALWDKHLAQMREAALNVRAGWPRSRLIRFDPWALRSIIILFAVAAFFMAGEARWQRLKDAFAFGDVLPASSMRVDAWLSPPAYTGRAPILLRAERGEAQAGEDETFTVPTGSRLVVRANSSSLDVAIHGAAVPDLSDDDKKPPAGILERRFLISGDATAALSHPVSGRTWRFAVVPDRAPAITFAKPPERQARGSLLLAYTLDDDYGVVSANAQFAVRAKGSVKGAVQRRETSPRPLFEAPNLTLVLPPGRVRQGKAQTIKDLTDHPWAGADVSITLSARDEGGNEGHSEAVATTLPQRPFANALSRALIELRRLLAMDADQRPLVSLALDALMLAPQAFTPKAGHYLGLRNVARELENAGSDDELRGVVASLWALAVSIEDGNLSDVEKELRAAQEALRQALERGASEEELKQLMNQLRAAMDKFLQQLAEQMRRNPQQAQTPLDPNARVVSRQDLQAMLERLEKLARSGDKDAARQLLEQLQAMMENLRTARPAPNGQNQNQSALNELGDILRKQQRLRDRTFREGQDNSGAGKPNKDALKQDQQALRDRLGKLLDQLRQRGLVPQPGQKNGQKGGNENGQDGGQNGQQLGEAGEAMGEAEGRLGQGNNPGAADSQGRAIEALRRGAQGLAQQLQAQRGEGQQGDGENGEPGDGQSGRNGRQAGDDSPQTDPLGRPYRGRDFGDDTSVKIPGEIDVQRARRILDELRRRFSEQGRPQLELEYLERLLKDY